MQLIDMLTDIPIARGSAGLQNQKLFAAREQLYEEAKARRSPINPYFPHFKGETPRFFNLSDALLRNKRNF